MVGEILAEEDAAGRGMLTVIVIHKEGDMQPGPGILQLVTQLGLEASDSRTRLLVELAQVTKSPVERQHLLEESIRLNGNLVAAAAARLMMRDGFAGRAD